MVLAVIEKFDENKGIVAEENVEQKDVWGGKGTLSLKPCPLGVCEDARNTSVQVRMVFTNYWFVVVENGLENVVFNNSEM